MSFLSILKKIGTVALGVEHAAAPFISVAYPGFQALDSLFQRLASTVVTVEQNNPVDGAGALKAEAVKNDFAAGLQTTQDVLALTKKKLTYDDALLQQAIDAQVLAYNTMAKLKGSFKVVDL
jgi:hypothetical protein